MTRTCSVPGCGCPHKARGWCTGHYKRWSRTGQLREADPLGAAPPGSKPTVPFEPVERLAALHIGPLPNRKKPVTHLLTTHGINREQASRWRKDGVPLDVADDLACALGEHPSAIWPEWWEVAS